MLMLAERGVNTAIVVTKEVLEKIRRKYKGELKRYMKYKNATMLMCQEEIRVAFTSTNFFLSMRLFLNDGSYDFYKNIISHDKSALKWGEELFRYYEKRSERVELQDL
jgi:predicted transcriptional regulator